MSQDEMPEPTPDADVRAATTPSTDLFAPPSRFIPVYDDEGGEAPCFAHLFADDED